MKRILSDLIELSKLRLCLLAVLMGGLGFLLGEQFQSKPIDVLRLVFTLVGMLLIGASSGALNQYLERELDLKMKRTKNRPLPSGRMRPATALRFGIATALLGESILLLLVNPVTAVLGALTLFFYLAVYTPYKRVSSISTLIGAIPGALPPLMGWTASYGLISAPGVVLFAILFLWQIPHFLAIAWIYREDYGKAEFPVLPVVDPDVSSTRRQMVLYTVSLIAVSLLPRLWGIAGLTYFFGAVFLGLLFLGTVLAFVSTRRDAEARWVFKASLLYLPLLVALLAWDFKSV